MSCEAISQKFEVEIVIKEVTVKNAEPDDDVLKLELEFLGNKIEAETENGEEENKNSMLFVSGCHSFDDLRFRLSNEASGISNEEFTFNLLGNPLIGMNF